MIIKILILCMSAYCLNNAFANPTIQTRCENVYQACLADTGLPKDQILMGVRGNCRDQQNMCKAFHKQYSQCLKDYGQKACQRIYTRPT